MILHYYTNYGKLMPHLCILVLPIYFKCVHGYTQHMYPHTHIYVYMCVYMYATAQGAVLWVKNYQVFSLSKTDV